MSGFSELTRGKTHSTPSKLSGVYRGVVSRIDGNGRLFVKISRVTFSLEYGPLDFVISPQPYAVGDLVSVESVEGYPDAFLVTGKIGPSTSSSSGVTLVTNDYTLLGVETLILVNSSSLITISLPDPTAGSFQKCVIKQIGSGGVNIQSDGDEFDVTASLQYEAYEVVPDKEQGTWWISNHFIG